MRRDGACWRYIMARHCQVCVRYDSTAAVRRKAQSVPGDTDSLALSAVGLVLANTVGMGESVSRIANAEPDAQDDRVIIDSPMISSGNNRRCRDLHRNKVDQRELCRIEALPTNWSNVIHG